MERIVAIAILNGQVFGDQGAEHLGSGDNLHMIHASTVPVH